MLSRRFAIGLATSVLLCVACGGGTPRATTADLAAIRQPTPDPTLDAVVRDLPRALAGIVVPTATPTPVVISTLPPKPKAIPATATARPITPVVRSAVPTVRAAALTTSPTSIKPRP